MPPFAGPMGP